jgi:hypothetical protein
MHRNRSESKRDGEKSQRNQLKVSKLARINFVGRIYKEELHGRTNQEGNYHHSCYYQNSVEDVYAYHKHETTPSSQSHFKSLELCSLNETLSPLPHFHHRCCGPLLFNLHLHYRSLIYKKIVSL